jgi:nitrate/nitrite-specific signal transduction histidine kinase
MQRRNLEPMPSSPRPAQPHTAQVDTAPTAGAAPAPADPDTLAAGLEIINAALLGLLAEGDARRPLLDLLQRIEWRTGLGPSAVFERESPGSPITLIAATAPDATAGMREAVARSAGCGTSPSAPVRVQRAAATGEFQVFVLRRAGLPCGWLVIGGDRGNGAGHANAALLGLVAERLGDVVGSAMHAARTRRHRLHEERATIARELHDSLAQSLSYLKIQVSRLHARTREAPVLDSPGSALTSDIVDELRASLNVAYRQLRELIATFRLTMNGRTLNQALEDSIEEFQGRSTIAFELDDRLEGSLLDAEEEIQVLQIAREALSNVVRHSHARHARLALREIGTRDILLSVRDDGIGVDAGHHGDQHHGLIIMQERARTLGGTLSVGPAADGGTIVQVRFTPRRRAGGFEE